MTRTGRVQKLLQRWRADRRGTAAIEFAFVAGPFLLMIFAIIELALIFLLSTSLDAASDQAGRKIRTGQFQSAGQTKDDFKADVCAKMTWLAGNCSTALVVNVQTYDTYAQVVNYDPVDTTGGTKTMKPEADFPASLPPQRIVVIRSFYKWPLITPLLNQGLIRLDGGVALVSSTQTFQTEPF